MKPLSVRLHQLKLGERTLDQLTSLLKKRQRKYNKRPPEQRRRLLRLELGAIRAAIALLTRSGI